ncbi:ferritin-like domain-containing protein, partial [Usnea florida]
PPVNSATDESVLNLALYLEHLEFALYSGGYENFTDAQYTAAGFPPGFRENVGVIASHEATHVATISAILEKSGYPPVPACSYKFPYNSPTSFVDLANMITSVGIGAYLGGAELITDDPTLEVASASILTVEARHDAYLRAGVGGSPFPTNFDTALTATFAYNLAQMFIVECPQQLPLTILPKLTLESPKPPSN